MLKSICRQGTDYVKGHICYDAWNINNIKGIE